VIYSRKAALYSLYVQGGERAQDALSLQKGWRGCKRTHVYRSFCAKEPYDDLSLHKSAHSFVLCTKGGEDAKDAMFIGHFAQKSPMIPYEVFLRKRCHVYRSFSAKEPCN